MFTKFYNSPLTRNGFHFTKVVQILTHCACKSTCHMLPLDYTGIDCCKGKVTFDLIQKPWYSATQHTKYERFPWFSGENMFTMWHLASYPHYSYSLVTKVSTSIPLAHIQWPTKPKGSVILCRKEPLLDSTSGLWQRIKRLPNGHIRSHLQAFFFFFWGKVSINSLKNKYQIFGWKCIHKNTSASDSLTATFHFMWRPLHVTL